MPSRRTRAEKCPSSRLKRSAAGLSTVKMKRKWTGFLRPRQEVLDRLKDEDALSASSVNHYRTILNSIFKRGHAAWAVPTRAPYGRSISSASFPGATDS